MDFSIVLFSALNQGLMWGLVAIGVYFSFRILDFADMTCEGSLVIGGAITAITFQAGLPPFLAIPFALLCGAGAGFITGLLHTKLKIPPILAGILTMTAFYSINLLIMDGAMVSISNTDTLTTGLTEALIGTGMDFRYGPRLSEFIIFFIIVAVVVAVIYWFFGTEFGCTIRATGMNPKMCRAQGINTNTTIIVGLMISNALIALAGCLMVHQKSNVNADMGKGALVIGLASIIIGEAMTGKKFSFWAKLIMLVVGSMIYCLVEQLILLIPGFNPDIFKLIVAIMVALVLAIPAIKNGAGPLMQKLFGKKEKGEEMALATAGGEGVINEDDIIVEDNDVKGEEENAEN